LMLIRGYPLSLRKKNTDKAKQCMIVTLVNAIESWLVKRRRET
jgi:hypothetical protein